MITASFRESTEQPGETVVEITGTTTYALAVSSAHLADSPDDVHAALTRVFAWHFAHVDVDEIANALRKQDHV